MINLLQGHEVGGDGLDLLRDRRDVRVGGTWRLALNSRNAGDAPAGGGTRSGRPTAGMVVQRSTEAVAADRRVSAWLRCCSLILERQQGRRDQQGRQAVGEDQQRRRLI